MWRVVWPRLWWHHLITAYIAAQSCTVAEGSGHVAKDWQSQYLESRRSDDQEGTTTLMSERQAAWRAKPSPAAAELLQQLPDHLMFMVHRSGPTAFVVREDGSEVKRKVVIGSRPSCSCQGTSASHPPNELCLHILFVMVKVLRLNPDNPLVWQLSLTDRELDEVLRAGAWALQPSHTNPAAANNQPAAAAGKINNSTPGAVTRRAVEDEEPCPICYEDMQGQDEAMLVWCRTGCGHNIHGRCMRVWAEHQADRLQKELTCPLCRTPWGEFNWRPPPPPRKPLRRRRTLNAQPPAGSAAHEGTSCAACKTAPIQGQLYRCVTCSHYDLCEACFSGGHHPQHSFACKVSPTALPCAVSRSDMMPAAVSLVSQHSREAQIPRLMAPRLASAMAASVAQQVQGIDEQQAAGTTVNVAQRIVIHDGHDISDSPRHQLATHPSLPSHPTSARSAPAESQRRIAARPFTPTLLHAEQALQVAAMLTPISRRISAPTSAHDSDRNSTFSTQQQGPASASSNQQGDSMLTLQGNGVEQLATLSGSSHGSRINHTSRHRGSRITLEPLPAGVGPPVQLQQAHCPTQTSLQMRRTKRSAGTASGRLQPLSRNPSSVGFPCGAFMTNLTLEGQCLQPSQHALLEAQAVTVAQAARVQHPAHAGAAADHIAGQLAQDIMHNNADQILAIANEQVHLGGVVVAARPHRQQHGKCIDSVGTGPRVRAGRGAGLPPAGRRHVGSSTANFRPGNDTKRQVHQAMPGPSLHISGSAAAPTSDQGPAAAHSPAGLVQARDQQQGHVMQGLAGLRSALTLGQQRKLGPRAAAAAAAIARAEVEAAAAIAGMHQLGFGAVGVAMGKLGGADVLSGKDMLGSQPVAATRSSPQAGASARSSDVQAVAAGVVYGPGLMPASMVAGTRPYLDASLSVSTDGVGQLGVAPEVQGRTVAENVLQYMVCDDHSGLPAVEGHSFAAEEAAAAIPPTDLTPAGSDVPATWNRVFSNPAFGLS